MVEQNQSHEATAAHYQWLTGRLKQWSQQNQKKTCK